MRLKRAISEILHNKTCQTDATSVITQHKCLAYSECVILRPQYLITLPSVLGILTDRNILEVFNQYLALKSHVIQPFIYKAYYIGRRGREYVVDSYNDVVAQSMLQCGDVIWAHK